jgi:hypothetical protein
MEDEIVAGGGRRPLLRRRARKDGWTEKKKTIFLEHFAATANATASAAEAA